MNDVYTSYTGRPENGELFQHIIGNLLGSRKNWIQTGWTKFWSMDPIRWHRTCGVSVAKHWTGKCLFSISTSWNGRGRRQTIRAHLLSSPWASLIFSYWGSKQGSGQGAAVAMPDDVWWHGTSLHGIEQELKRKTVFPNGLSVDSSYLTESNSVTQKTQIYRRKFRSQTSDNMDRWKAEQGRGWEKRKIRREKIREEKESEERRCRYAKG